MSEGKRVAGSSGGQRAAGGGVKPGAVIAVIVGVLLAAYVAFCVWVGANGKVLPNVTIAGLDVSGMTQEEARTALKDAIDQHGDKAVVTVAYGEWNGSISLAEMPYQFPEYFGRRCAMDAVETGREFFLLNGFQYIRHLLGGSTEVPAHLEMWDTADVDYTALRELMAQAAEEIDDESKSLSDDYRVEGDRLVVKRGVTKTVLDGEAETKVILAFQEQAIPQLFKEGSGNVTVELPTRELAPDQTRDFSGLHAELYAEVAEPLYDKETGTVSDHVVGVDFDVNALKAAYEKAAEGETFSIPLTVTQPKDTKESFEKKLFADVLGSATSKVGGTANRKTNVKLSAAACDGVILLPGEIFAYNETTGSRSADKGYLPAPTYSAGASVDDVGGGICQTSSTIYYALLHTTLEVVERQNHSYATGYVPDGMDATVFYGSLDFRFKNSTNYPLKVVTESYDKNGSRYLKVTLMGTNEDGRYAKPTNEVYDVVEPTKSYVADNSVPQGTLVLDKEQNAYRGRKAQVTRTIYEADGTVVERQNMGVSRYKMRPHLYHYNPLDGDPTSWPNGVPPQPAPVVPVEPVAPAEPVTPAVPETPAAPVVDPAAGTAAA